ncbi:Suppressor APC domain-containing protein 2 [Trichinella nativa]|uniref:Suppressor APC domain-containing protein 2 n=3 Tax=Trichinella TaxID=6333 RepID=A0A0V1KZU2_9BILA|nr:Suppressor APC domain-containing protein 2 [Trichinella murrelli]KRX63282.1 Suppressor APC domain-containing protein 2 [Trichinella sp. T9]KRX78278.1 Suppressor APC domain-containing protein 2 [Trichinella sp. T6]KRZ52816.1 Suppressor APC domain-containing protein 2 [Trichinella nativa]KRZ85230.1 Suppressor APC domain-containing protein 2 [Trichinella sp. T8]
MNWRRFGKKSTSCENNDGDTALPVHLQQQLKGIFDECDTDRSGFVQMESFRQRCFSQLQQQTNGKSTSGTVPWNRFIDQLIICTPTSGVVTLERCYAAMRAALTDFKSNIHAKAASNSVVVSNVDNSSWTKSRPAYSMTDRRQLRWSSYHRSGESNGNVHQFAAVQVPTSSARQQNSTLSNGKIFTLNEISQTDCSSNNHYPPSVVSVAYSRPVSSIGNGNVDSDYGSIMSYEGVRLRDRTTLYNGNGRQIADYNRRRTVMVPDGSPPSNSLKQNQLMEEELSILEQGQDKANRLINWYHERLSALKTRNKLMGRSLVTLELAVHEEKLNFLRSQVSDLNRRIVGLMESSEKGFPSAANLANVGRKALLPEDDQHLWLKKQNQLLTEEVTDKTRRLAKLEQEKAKLIQLLFQKNNNHVNQCNTVSSTPMSNGCLQNSKFVSMDAIQATLM